MTRPPDAKPAVLVETERAQRTASDPGVSAWVSANAGAGKTHVLKMRVLRLLLAGAAPERILCLTFTKAAAAEMAARVFEDLSAWAVAPPAELEARLAALLGRMPEVGEAAAARQLFARAIETPGGLKVQTIHAFCERLLQRFPLEAGVPPGFTILDEEASRRLVSEAIVNTLHDATRDGGGVLGRSLKEIVTRVQGERFDALMARAMQETAWLEEMSRFALREPEGDERVAARRLYCHALEIPEEATPGSVEAEMSEVIDGATIEAAIAELAGGSKTEQRLADALRRARSAPNRGSRIAALREAFLTGKGHARADSQFTGVAFRKRNPALSHELDEARDRFAGLAGQLALLESIDASVALATVAGAVAQHYRDAKVRSAALDYDDLIRRTARLLASAESAEWVLYKLDGGLDHILVDEAQDTSPAQWSVIEALVREFFAGAGAQDRPRTVFAVGDEKQSIYSFQGAAPRMFGEVGRRIEALARGAGAAWQRVPLTLSFRTVAPVLKAVDRVFADAERTPGVTPPAESGPLRHAALRTASAGLVEVWPLVSSEKTDLAGAFDPLAAVTSRAPAAEVAARIGDLIRAWLDKGEVLASQGRPIRAGDILILVRARRPFAPLMISALKARRIPVAGADRMILEQQVAVDDLLALARVLLLPEDDLALGQVLKSPLFGLDDDDLLALAPARQGALFKALLATAAANPRFAEAASLLRRWRGLADYLPPFELMSRILDGDGMRRRFLARLGLEAAEGLDELLRLALDYDDRSPPSLQGFVEALESSRHEIKREMEQGRDQVRVMTVHGAKGLEAPIVFLPDTCSSGRSASSGPLISLGDASLPVGMSRALIWALQPARSVERIESTKRAIRAVEAEEHQRLLYVAMTRARDRLYVAGFHGERKPHAACWYNLVSDGLAELLADTEDDKGTPVRRLEGRQQGPVETPRGGGEERIEPRPPPAFATTPARAEVRAVIPLAPSRLQPLEIDEEGEPRAHARDGGAVPDARGATGGQEARLPPAPSPRHLAADQRFLRGTLTHALLEHLPSFPTSEWSRLAEGFVATRAAQLSASFRASVVAEALAVLSDVVFAPAFGPDSRAEVAVVAELTDPSGKAPPVRVSGQIDRLVLTAEGALVIDYKTNRPPPTDLSDVPAAYLVQLAAYRLAVRQALSVDNVQCALVWTCGARLMPIPTRMLDNVHADLWALASTRLDAARRRS